MVRGEFHEDIQAISSQNFSGQPSQSSSAASSNSQSPSIIALNNQTNHMSSKHGQSNVFPSSSGGNNSSSSSLTGISSGETSNTWSSSAQKLARITNKIVDSISTPKSTHRPFNSNINSNVHHTSNGSSNHDQQQQNNFAASNNKVSINNNINHGKYFISITSHKEKNWGRVVLKLISSTLYYLLPKKVTQVRRPIILDPIPQMG